MLLAMFASVLAPIPAASPLPSWLAGYWIECSAGRETAESWSDARGGVMLGASKTVSVKRTSWEYSRIAPSGDGISFFADPSGQASTEFKAIELSERRVVFENRGHDFPQRVIYQRDADRLDARIEGEMGGQAKAIEWHYRLRPINSTCP
ncbi:DUF6265 family protein [Sphingomonas crocodyli]|uniref:DUF6265 domain-containing protein n=1 Tax=Sphingomonas crocodyli TaxID=1979270 RepID=A0A437M030_9SPHN|nr:DUF6265 family protein [Sphingomonas crocodyli]RVT91059.1 hypothetical protein EOD43_16150 [Sphingomonas crocodyli]